MRLASFSRWFIWLVICFWAPLQLTTKRLSAQETAERVSGQGQPTAYVKFPREFVDVTHSAGIDFYLTAGSTKKNYIFESLEGGVAVFDFDNDGWPDLYFVNGTTMELGREHAPAGKLYRNLHNGKFQDVTSHSGISARGWCFGAAVGDYDNDGLDDLLITCLGRNYLYRNTGNGKFVDVTVAAGVLGGGWSTSASFGDYDNDGKLDLIVARYVEIDPENPPPFGSGRFCSYRGLPVYCGPRGMRGERDLLYHNNGDGTFTEVGHELGIDAHGWNGLAAIWGDVDNDGRLDLYIANDSTPSLLYHNVTPHGGPVRFEEIGMESGVAYGSEGQVQSGMGVDSGDYDNDGWIDIVKTNFSDDAINLYHNNRDGTFTDLSFEAGLADKTRTSVGLGVIFADLENTGHLDLVVANGHMNPQVDSQPMGISYAERNLLFMNLNNGKFADVSAQAGPGFASEAVNRGLATIDFDNDGFTDLIFTRLDASPALLHNLPSSHDVAKSHWLTIKLEGTRSNRDGFGARVTVRQRAGLQIQEVRSNRSYLSASDPRVHFGLGEDSQSVEIEVKWPSGRLDTCKNVPVDRFLHIKEGNASCNVITY